MFDHTETSLEGDVVVHHWQSTGVKARTKIRRIADGGGVSLEMSLWCDRGCPETIDSIILLAATMPDGEFSRVYQTRRDVWLPAGIRNADGTRCSAGPEPSWDADNLIALFTPDENALLAGVAHPCHHGLEMRFREGVLEVRMPLARDRAPGERLDCDTVLLCGSMPLVEGLEWYGRCNRLRSRPPAFRERFVVWNTWDWFHGTVTQDDIVAMADCIRDDPLFGEHVNVLALDDGWQVDWDTGTVDRSAFPDLAAMAAAVRKKALVPGIWYAPFRVKADCAWVKEHPETVLWGEPRPVFPIALTPEASRRVLDYTHPLVLRKVHDDLRRLYDAGFRYYKIDFIQHPNTYFRRPDLHDPSVSPTEGVRRIMHTVRAAIGYDSYWLACGTEPAAVAGLPDAARVGDDITYRFGTQQVCVRNCAIHFWMNGNLWINDPDFLIVRGADTQDTPYLSREQEETKSDPAKESREYHLAALGSGGIVGLEEARCWANFHIVYGGALSLGDHPSRLNAAGRELITTVLAYRQGTAPGVPLDLDRRNLPGMWLRPYEGGWLLGLFNYYDDPMRLALDERARARIGAVQRCEDIWSGREEPFDPATWSLELPPHTSRVLRLWVTPEERR